MKNIESGPSFNPEQQQSKQEQLGQTQIGIEQPQREKERKFDLKTELGLIAKSAKEVGKTFGMAALGLTLAYGAWRGAERTSEHALETQYPQTHEKILKLEQREQKLKDLFGSHYTPVSERMSKTEILARTLLGSENPLEAIRGEAETEHTEKTQITDIPTNLGTINAGVMKKVFETFPRGWINNEVHSISFEEGALKPNPKYEYGLDETFVTLATCTAGTPKTKENITFYGAVKNLHPMEVMETLAHETAHANDWDSDGEMTAEQRVDLLIAVTERLRSNDRYRSSYVESISNPDKKKSYI